MWTNMLSVFQYLYLVFLFLPLLHRMVPHNPMLNRRGENGHSLFFDKFIKESFKFSALSCDIWPLFCISTGSLAQAGFLPCPRERWLWLLLLHLALYLFLESVATRFAGLSPAVGCCYYWLQGECLFHPHRPTALFLPLSQRRLPLPGTIGWRVS